MPGIGDQRHRAVEEAEGRLDNYEAGVEHHADQECLAEILGRMVVAVMVVQAVALDIAVVA